MNFLARVWWHRRVMLQLASQLRRCTKCARGLSADFKYTRCSVCRATATREWRARNPEAVRRHNSVSRAKNPDMHVNCRLKRSYGIDLREYRAMLVEQNGSCAICAGPPVRAKAYDVDHDHVTGDVRGLLCNSCNQMLGHARDRIETLLAGAEYLRRSRT